MLGFWLFVLSVGVFERSPNRLKYENPHFQSLSFIPTGNDSNQKGDENLFQQIMYRLTLKSIHKQMKDYTCPLSKCLIDYPVIISQKKYDYYYVINNDRFRNNNITIDKKLMKKIWSFRLKISLKILKIILLEFGKKTLAYNNYHVKEALKIVKSQKIRFKVKKFSIPKFSFSLPIWSHQSDQTPTQLFSKESSINKTIKYDQTSQENYNTSQKINSINDSYLDKISSDKKFKATTNVNKAFNNWKKTKWDFVEDNSINFPKLMLYLRQLKYICGNRLENENDHQFIEMKVCYHLLKFAEHYINRITENKVPLSYEIENKIVLNAEYPVQGGSIRCLLQLKSRPNIIVAGSRSGLVALIDIVNIEDIVTMKMHNNQIRSMIETPNGNILTCSYSGKIKIWNLVTNTVSVFSNNTRKYGGLLPLNDGIHFIYYLEESIQNNVMLYRFSDQTPVNTFTIKGSILRAIQLKDGLLAISTTDSELQICNIFTGKILRNWYTFRPMNILTQLKSGVLLSATSSDPNDKIYFWEINKLDRELCSYTSIKKSITSIVELSDRVIAVGSWEKKIHFLNPTTGRCIRQVDNHDDCPYSLLYLDDGTLVVGGYERILLYK